MKTTKKFGSGGGRVELRLKVAAADRDAAEKLARLRTLQGLEAMLGDLVADIATAYERPGSWEAGRIWEWLDCRYDLPQFLRLEREEGGQ